jgi:two-component system, sensor histidine kinase LadS
MAILRHYFFTLLLILAPVWATGQELGQVFEDSRTLALAAPLQWQVLPKDKVRNPDEFDSLGLAQNFAALRPQQALPTARSNDVWLRFALPVTATPQMWYLRIPRLQVERVTLYFQDEQKVWRQQVAGDDVPIARWPLVTRNPSFELGTRIDRPQLYFLKLEHRIPITERPQLVAPSDYIDGAQRVGTLVGLVFGLFGLLTVLGLVTARLYRNSQYAWYGLMVAMLLLSQITLVGYAGLRLWPSSVYLNKIMPALASLWTLAAITWFTTQVSYAKLTAPRIYKCSVALVAVLLLTSLAYAVYYHDFPRDALLLLAGCAMLWNLGSMVWMAWRAQSLLWFVVAGLAPLTLAMLARLTYYIGWLAHVELTQLLGAIAACLGMMVVYAGMILRSRETYAALERETALAHTDISTGLTLARIAAIRLPQLLTRSKRFGKPCGVVMVRWLGYDAQLQPMSSAQAGAVLAHFGARLRRLARDIDTVARYDNDHFLFLVEAPVSREALNDLGTKILSTCMRPSVQLGNGDIYNVHVAICLAMGDTLAAQQVMETLRTRLSQMDPGTARKVQFVDAPLSTRPPSDGPESTGNLSGQALVAKINAIEASPILPTVVRPSQQG